MALTWNDLGTYRYVGTMVMFREGLLTWQCFLKTAQYLYATHSWRSSLTTTCTLPRKDSMVFHNGVRW